MRLRNEKILANLQGTSYNLYKQEKTKIDWTIQQEQLTDKQNTLEAARLIFKNMGIALPNGTMEEVKGILATNDYMGWRKCRAKEAQDCANDGTAAIAVKGNEIVIIKAEPDDKDESITATSANTDTASPLSQLEGQEDAQFYSYSTVTTCRGTGNFG